MNLRHTTGFCCAVALGFTVSVSAQQGSTTSGAQASPDTNTQADSLARTVTVTGCIQKEADIFQTRGIGSSDEFVLTKASSGSASMASADTSGSADAGSSSTSGSTAPQDGEDASDRTVGTSGAASSTMAAHGAHGSMYSLTGDREDELTRLVGRRVEVTGRLEHSGDAMNAGHEDAATRGAVGTSGSSDSIREEADDAEGSPSDDDSQPRATNTGRGDRIPGRAGAATPEEIAAAAARERLQAMPRVNITSFRDLGACDAQ